MRPHRFVGLAILISLALCSSTSGTGPLQFYSVTPCRLVDTRGPIGPHGAPAIAAGANRAFPVFGQFASSCGIPNTAKAICINATIIGPSANGYITIWPNNSPWPGTANINFNAGEPALANGAIVKLTYPPNDNVDPNYQILVTSVANLNLVIDITGYFQ